MTQAEVERAVAEAAAGSRCSSERVTCRHPDGVWEVLLRCPGCGTYRFLVIERMDDVTVPEQVRKEVERHGRRHSWFAHTEFDAGRSRAKS